MRLIQTHTDYATRAIIFLAQSGQPIVSTADLETDMNLPRPYIRKILQVLQREGILTSSKGHKGGFSLALPVEKIFLMDLINIFQGGLELPECLFRKKVCPNIRACPIRQKVKNIEKGIVSQLGGITIADLMKKG